MDGCCQFALPADHQLKFLQILHYIHYVLVLSSNTDCIRISINLGGNSALTR